MEDEDRKLKTQIFGGFEAILDIWSEEEIKAFEDGEYEFVLYWENDLKNWSGTNRIDRYFEFKMWENPDIRIRFQLSLERASKSKITRFKVKRAKKADVFLFKER